MPVKHSPSAAVSVSETRDADADADQRRSVVRSLTAGGIDRASRSNGATEARAVDPSRQPLLWRQSQLADPGDVGSSLQSTKPPRRKQTLLTTGHCAAGVTLPASNRLPATRFVTWVVGELRILLPRTVLKSLNDASPGAHASQNRPYLHDCGEGCNFPIRSHPVAAMNGDR
jgi:hypothetical protein